MIKSFIILILAIFLVNSAQAFSKEQMQKLYLKKPSAKPISTKILLNQTEVPNCELEQVKNVTIAGKNSSSLRGSKDSKKDKKAPSESKKGFLGSL